jgi:hypothetical protein
MAEISLLDTRGNAVAYIADDGEASIYLWSGHAVAYLVQEKVYGWNGQHLGWFDSGIMRDLKGAQVGFTRDTCPVTPKTEKTKRTKRTKRTKSTRRTSKTRASNKTSKSTVPLDVFLQGGAK